jgi:hypothetical protein
MRWARSLWPLDRERCGLRFVLSLLIGRSADSDFYEQIGNRR